MDQVDEYIKESEKLNQDSYEPELSTGERILYMARSNYYQQKALIHQNEQIMKLLKNLDPKAL